MELRSIAERVEEIASKAVATSDIELVRVEIAGTKRDQVLRVFIDKEGGVTLDDCSRVSQRIEAVLDAEDIIPTRYVLEVSSPGIERQLYSLADFAKFSGKLAKVRLKTKIDGQQTLVGTIAGVAGNAVSFDDRNLGSVTFNYEQVDKANLKIDLAKEFSGK